MRKLRAAVCCTLGVAVMTVAQSASAANWIKLQGVSPALAPLVSVSGYFQPTYTYLPGTAAANGQVPHLNQIAPNFTSSNSFNIDRARLMIRGNINKDISYFLAAEFGNNAFTHIGGAYTPALMDGHVTFSHYIPGVRVEAGIIRAPGPEQAMQGYMAYNFTSFANVTTQMMLQPFYNPNPDLPGVQNNGTAAAPVYAVPGSYGEGNNAFRYTGLEAMDWFRNGPWQFTYAAMVGNFGPLTATNYSNSPLVAARLQESYIFGGHGPFQSNLTGFIWYQHATPDIMGQGYSMTRDGLGVTYMQGYMHQWGRWAKFEYMRGSGMISTPSVFSSFPGAPSTGVLTDAQVYPGSQNTAHGYYVSGGLFVTRRVEVDLRYDYYNRLPNIAAQNRTFSTWAVGLQYHFTPLTRVILDYYVRSVGIPHPGAIKPSPTLAESIANSADNELALQAVIAF